MNINIFKAKPKLTNDNNEEYLDLSYNSYNNNINFTSILGIEVVTKNTEMRLDKIAMKYYKTTEYLDLLCKVNNIFNPFSIKDGDILIIPNIPQKEKIYKNTGEIVKKDIRKNYVDKARLSTKDKNRLERLKAKVSGKSNASSTPLPPNILKENESNKTYKNGGIKLG